MPKKNKTLNCTPNGASGRAAGSALAKRIARTIFMCGDEPHSKCNRIQFKGGSYPSSETNQGGLNESALIGVIERALKKPNEKLSV